MLKVLSWWCKVHVVSECDTGDETSALPTPRKYCCRPKLSVKSICSLFSQYVKRACSSKTEWQVAFWLLNTKLHIGITRSFNTFCFPCIFCRSVWRSTSGHAKLHAWRDASIWAGSSYGAPLPGRPSHGHEAARHVSSWALLKQQSSHHIRFEVNTFLSSLCFFKPSCKQRAVRPVVVKTNFIC